jgi:hypothetical protein
VARGPRGGRRPRPPRKGAWSETTAFTRAPAPFFPVAACMQACCVKHVWGRLAMHARDRVNRQGVASNTWGRPGLHAARAPPRLACLRAWDLAPPGRIGCATRIFFPFLFFVVFHLYQRDPSRLGLEFVFIVSLCYFPNCRVSYAAVLNSSSTFVSD